MGRVIISGLLIIDLEGKLVGQYPNLACQPDILSALAGGILTHTHTVLYNVQWAL